MYKFIRLFLPLFVSAAMMCSLSACTEISEEAPVQITETAAVEEMPYPVQVGAMAFEHSPETVGSLSPAVTEIICELGFGDRIIGRSSYCTYPESISTKNVLGSSANPDVDAIIAAAPELLISMSPIAKKDITAIEAAGTRVWIISPPTSAEELYSCYNDIALAFGGSIDGKALAEDAVAPLKVSFEKAEGTMGSVLYIMSPDLAFASEGTFAGDFFARFGTNPVGETEDISITAEELVELDPRWIILPSYINKYELPEETAVLSAIKDGRVIYIDENDIERIERPTSRLEPLVYNILDCIEMIEKDIAEKQADSDEE